MILPISLSQSSVYLKQNNRINNAFQTPNLQRDLAYEGVTMPNNYYAVNFRGNATPVEVTHLYNKSVEGKDHLDLPNIHVYEFPDTNLRVFVNEDRNVSGKNESITRVPQALLKINFGDKTFLPSEVLSNYIINKIPNESIEFVEIKDKTSLTILFPTSFYLNKTFNNIDVILRGLNLNEDDLKNLGNSLGAQTGLSQESIMSNLKKDLSSISTEIYVTTNKNEIENCLDNITKIINSNINKKFSNKIKNNYFEKQVEILTAMLISSYSKFNKYYRIEEQNEIDSQYPYKIVSKVQEGEEHPKSSEILQEIMENNFEEILNEIKYYYKYRKIETLSDDILPLLKCVELSKHGTNIYTFTGTIDSISELDIKNCIRNLISLEISE